MDVRVGLCVPSQGMNMKTVRWGIIGPGRIAHTFAKALDVVEDARLTAVASRDLGRAEAFAGEYGAAHAFDSYDELASSDAVDAVYVATPHPQHAVPAKRCLENGKAVLCEKPFTVNVSELEELVRSSREKGVFLMEGMWTRFLPIMAVVRGWIDDGRIGEPHLVQADFGFRADWNPDSRVLSPNLAGGSLLDIGVYTIAFSNWIFGGEPMAVSGMATIGETGVDEQMAATLQYADGQLASIMTAVRTWTRQAATIYGSKGQIEVGPPFSKATKAILTAEGKPETMERPFLANGFEYEIIEACRCLREGLTESPVMPLDDSLGIMRTMDQLRAQWNLRYPFE